MKAKHLIFNYGIPLGKKDIELSYIIILTYQKQLV